MAILLFAGSHYYPGGGYNDFIGNYDSLEKATKEGERKLNLRKHTSEYCDWYHIMDGNTGKLLNSKVN